MKKSPYHAYMINPFSGYLDALARDFRDENITEEELKKIGFPVDPSFLFKANGTGLMPINSEGQKIYNIQELLGYTRLYSIPCEGFISKKPIRAAEILNCEFREYEDSYKPKINVVRVAAAFLPPEDRRRGSGQVVFVCPFCGDIHYHGADGKKFGDGDGDRVPHCLCTSPAYYRLNTQKFASLLAPNWHFYLEETDNFKRAGDFPSYFARHLVNRSKG